MSSDLFSLHGRNALVTGSTRGLGAGMARALAEAGAKVAIHGQADGDVADPAVCSRLIETTVRDFGSIDILINNAGIIRRASAEDYTAEDWNVVLETNLNAVFRLCQAAGAHMLRQGHGKIINIASMLSFQGGIRVPAYAAAKGAVAQLTKALANEWAPRGINVNAIAPGYMATDNTAALRNDPDRNRQILDRIPAARWGTPDDLAGAAVFLASRASDYVHGHVLVVDGGWLAR